MIMESPIRKLQKRNDYQRHKLFRKIKRKKKAVREQEQNIAEKELRKKLKLPKFNDGNNSQNQQIIYTQPTPQDLVSYVPRSRITFTDDGKFVYQNGEEVSVPLDEIVVRTKGGRPLTKVQEEIAKHNLLKQRIIDENGNQLKDAVYDPELDTPQYLKEKPLEQVSPEFYLLAAGVGAANSAISNTARGFMNYIQNPLVQNTTQRTAASMMGGLGTDMMMQATTGNTWGQAVNQLSWGYIPEWIGDMTNPGYFAESAITNSGNKLLNLLNQKIKYRPKILKQVEDKDYSIYGTNNELKNFLYKNYLFATNNNGFINSFINPPNKERIPNRIFEELDKSTIGRMRKYRPSIENLTDRPFINSYFKYDDSIFDKAGQKNTLAFAINDSYEDQPYKVAIRKSMFGKELYETLKHELRHTIDYKYPLVKEEKKLLDDAYGDDFIKAVEERYPDYKSAALDMVTTNRDARSKYENFSIDAQNQIINKLSDSKIIDALYNSNGYGKAYVQYLEKNNLITKEKIKAIREALKNVGMFGIPLGIAGISQNNSGKDIHIDKNKRGTFTRAAKARGMGVQEFAHKVLSAPKGKYSSNMRKKANFARNASKFKH